MIFLREGMWQRFLPGREGLTMTTRVQMLSKEQPYLGRPEAIKVSAKHHVNGNRTVDPFPEGLQMVVFGMGCFWGAERKFWVRKGVYSTQVGYAGGFTPNPNYKDVCSGMTGHAEVVRVVYHPDKICFEKLLKVFWESHDPTQGMRQGNDVGTQYRSVIYPYTQEQMAAALKSKEAYQKPQLLSLLREDNEDRDEQRTEERSRKEMEAEGECETMQKHQIMIQE
ncbi:mitochondrial peptide methionine sulfoxide reductase isoform X3 [Stegostoma tigrinum]|uniref:mitochondrial peptide methionine sulfoxide reductase isoform X3 n=1 Tax=Stegostoma tigrinum TaxID=3053191 RepID=UPI00286FB0B6|nr:mitochondrial peptide methionine sulfoxide reductase isoform X3 [Stegostoma tigrinum]